MTCLMRHAQYTWSSFRLVTTDAYGTFFKITNDGWEDKVLLRKSTHLQI